jgi:hypothetical protein
MADTDSFRLFTSLRYDRRLNDVLALEVAHAGWNHHNESPLYMLDLHRDRLLRAAIHWQWDKAAQILEGEPGLKALSEAILQSVGTDQESPLRVKVSMSKDGQLECEKSPVPETLLWNLFPEDLPAPGVEVKAESRLPSKTPVYEVVIDGYKTGRSEYTHFKTSRREMYDAARRRAGIRLGDNKEVLIVGDGGKIMEGSTTTPYFWRKGRWVTPPVSSRFSFLDGSGGNDGTTRRWALER